MSKFYGQVEGMANTIASRRGSKFIRVSAQSYDGSVGTRMHYDNDGRLMVEIQIADGESSFYGQSFFYGTLQELMEKLSDKKTEG